MDAAKATLGASLAEAKLVVKAEVKAVNIPSLSVFLCSKSKMSDRVAYQRVQAKASVWDSLGDVYVSNVIREGLRLPWIEGFDARRPDPSFRPAWTFNSDLPAQVDDLIAQSLDEGVISEIPFSEVNSLSQIFAIPKKELGQWRLITNLKNVNPFLQTTYF